MIFPPGTILQRIYLRERIRKFSAGHFLEVGCGAGWTSRILLDQGWSGTGIDLHAPSAEEAAKNNCDFVSKKKYRTLCGDFLTEKSVEAEKFDLIISCMVIEHLDEAAEGAYFRRCHELLTETGRIVLLVPSSPDHWGIEDETAGHLRRYTRESLSERVKQFGWKPSHVCGLTFPVSNLLFRLSNYLIRRADTHKLALTAQQQTQLSGARKIVLKDQFPRYLGLILNEIAMLPLHVLQKCFGSHPHCMVLYAECVREG